MKVLVLCAKRFEKVEFSALLVVKNAMGFK